MLKNFLYHQVSRAVAEEMTLVRELYYHLAKQVDGLLPNSDSKESARDFLETSLMFAIRSLATEKGIAMPIGTVIVTDEK